MERRREVARATEYCWDFVEDLHEKGQWTILMQCLRSRWCASTFTECCNVLFNFLFKTRKIVVIKLINYAVLTLKNAAVLCQLGLVIFEDGWFVSALIKFRCVLFFCFFKCLQRMVHVVPCQLMWYQMSKFSRSVLSLEAWMILIRGNSLTLCPIRYGVERKTINTCLSIFYRDTNLPKGNSWLTTILIIPSMRPWIQNGFQTCSMTLTPASRVSCRTRSIFQTSPLSNWPCVPSSPTASFTNIRNSAHQIRRESLRRGTLW